MSSVKSSSDAIRILHITFNMGIGGTEQVIRQLVLATREQGIHHEIVCIDGLRGAMGDLLAEAGVPVHTLDRSPGFDWALIRSLRALIRSGKFDIVHCHQYTPFVYGRLAALGTEARVVFTEHGRFYPDRFRWKAIFINPLLAIITPALVAISSATRKALALYEFIPRYRIRVIYNGIQPLSADPDRVAEIRAELCIAEGAFVFGTVSRLDPVKNQKMMLRAFARCLETCPNSALVMVGDGPDRENLEVQARSLGISDKVRFTGFINEPAQYLALMDCFLLTSHTEGTSMTLLESMSLAIPAVVTDVGGNPEIVKGGETGLLVRGGDTEQFAGGMVMLQQSPELCERLGQCAQERFRQRFSVVAMADGYRQLYDQVIQSRIV
ncbi:glycosyltransferase [Marinobacter flavimaris]|jgi:glycosyltransferase involved in cell wall biosynthesis|uniref:Glycosyltransferase n=1 Tax=Marinobacter flavimaris TaxID=262076 RepID=A0A3D8H7R5_9GAMM|nr:glycosyltransferase [Marinobacter flavimaris]PPI79362.1 glycosyltransferase [Marinobacter flavimaris]RDU42774.1 glycosyltransferase [Marinobacter flavimaris]